MSLPSLPPPSLLTQQQALLDALWQPPHRADSLSTPSDLPSTSKSIAIYPLLTSDRGIKIYKSNAHALAERVLSAAYPVVTALLSAETMALLAHALWQAHPPQHGDLAHWGADLPVFWDTAPQLVDGRTEWPWLSDVARLEWALHRADTAADAPEPDAHSLHLLGTHDPAHLHLRWAAATRVLWLDWTVQAVVTAHQRPPQEWPQALAALGTPWATHQPQAVLMARRGWRVQHRALGAQEAAFIAAQLSGQALLPALEQHPVDWATWLPHAWQEGWVVGVDVL
jgi:Putative DNA-binding domain